MRKIILSSFLFLISFISYSQTPALVQASLGVGSQSNRIKIYLKPSATQTPANISTLQFNVAVSSSVAPKPTVSVVSTTFAGVTWVVTESTEGGYYNYMITTATSPIQPNTVANTEFEALEVEFSGGLPVVDNVLLVTLPDGGTGASNGNALFLSTGSLFSDGSNLYYTRTGVVVNNQFSYDENGINSGTTTSTASLVSETSITCPSNTTVSASAGQCTAVVNNIEPVVSPQGSSFTYTLTGATTGNGNGSASGQTFNAGVTTVNYALVNSPATNCSFTVTVNTNIIPSVSIAANPGNTICSGTNVTFTATPTNGGTPAYQWKLNGNNTGTNSNTYQNSTLVNGDVITVVMTSSLACANPTTATSNAITMILTATVTPSVSISANPGNTICTGTNVTFTATPTNGGTPAYQWKLNGNNTGTNSNTYQNSTLVNGDVITVVMTSSLACASPTTATSNAITMVVTATVAPSVSIAANPGNTICAGTNVTFTATPTNGGATPSYQWKLNSNNVGDNSNTYQNSALVNGDVITVVMTSSLACANPTTATSNAITIVVTATVAPVVSIAANPGNTICAGTNVTFTATPTNGGTTPSYQWKLNSNNVGDNSNTYQNSALVNGDVITVVMTSSLACANPTTATSNAITMVVTATVAPSVSIAANPGNTICAGTNVTFTATPTNGGATPSYQWKLNGNDVGTNSNTYQNSGLINGDVVTVVLTSSLACANPTTATSNAITMVVTATVAPSVSIAANPGNTICAGTNVTFTATPTNGGATPSYQWKLNSNNVGDNSNTYQNSALVNGDVITVVMTSSLACANPTTATSNAVNMTVQSLLTFFRDMDADGFGDLNNTTQACTAPTGFVANSTDCNDNNAAIHPGATEICNDLDDDCDGQIDEGVKTTFFRDLDADGFGDLNNTTQACAVPTGFVTNSTDCNDNNVNIHPGATEICNNIDDDCDGQIDEGAQQVAWFQDADGDGFGNSAVSQQSCTQPTNFVLNNTDCNDGNANIHPGATEICGNGIDENCNGNADDICSPSDTDGDGVPDASDNCPQTANTNQTDTDGDGQGDACDNDDDNDGAADVNDCAPLNAAIYPGATEICGNGIDENCNGNADDICPPSDTDGDGVPDASDNCPQTANTNQTDTDGDGQGDACDSDDDNDGAADVNDCAPLNAAIHPGAIEICGNATDDDCSGTADENCDADLPIIVLRTYPVKEGNAVQTIFDVEVKLAGKTTLPVWINFATSNDEAIAGLDYVATNGTLQIPAGSESGIIQVKITGDLIREYNEHFWLNFSNPVNVIIEGDGRSRIMIIDDDKGRNNQSTTKVSKSAKEEPETGDFPIIIPNVVKRNLAWMIPSIINKENEVQIINVMGQVVFRVNNYRNNIPVGNVAAGIYFYRIRVVEKTGINRYYTGRLFITE